MKLLCIGVTLKILLHLDLTRYWKSTKNINQYWPPGKSKVITFGISQPSNHHFVHVLVDVPNSHDHHHCGGGSGWPPRRSEGRSRFSSSWYYLMTNMYEITPKNRKNVLITSEFDWLVMFSHFLIFELFWLFWCLWKKWKKWKSKNEGNTSIINQKTNYSAYKNVKIIIQHTKIIVPFSFYIDECTVCFAVSN